KTHDRIAETDADFVDAAGNDVRQDPADIGDHRARIDIVQSKQAVDQAETRLRVECSRLLAVYRVVDGRLDQRVVDRGGSGAGGKLVHECHDGRHVGSGGRCAEEIRQLVLVLGTVAAGREE